MKKKLSCIQLLKALIDGKKITSDDWNIDTYIQLIDNRLLQCHEGQDDGDGVDLDLNDTDYYIYEESKPKKTVYQWRWYNSHSGNWTICEKLLTKEQVKGYDTTDKYEIHTGPFEVEE